jgi:hypothetical protein
MCKPKHCFTLSLLALILSAISAEAQSAPGDEHWDYRFGLPEVDGAVVTIMVRGNETYVDGDFTLIGTWPAYPVPD